MSNTKKQHYVPKHYLRGFGLKTQPLSIWTYDLKNKRSFKNSIDNTAEQNYFYEFERADGVRDTQSVERWLAEEVESPACSSIDAIRSAPRVNITPLNKFEKEKISLYIGFLITRVPAFRARVLENLPEVVDNLVEKIENGQLEGIRNEKSREIAFEIIESYQKNLPSKFMLPFATDKIIDSINSMVWRFYWARGSQTYITCDNPVFFSSGIGLTDQRSEILLPLSSKVALLACRNKNLFEGHFHASNEMVIDMNMRIQKNASRFIYSTTEFHG